MADNGARGPKLGLLLVLMALFALVGIFADLASKSAHGH